MKNSLHIVYVISEIHKSLAFEWIAIALKDEYRLTFILLNPSSSPFEDFLISHNIEVYRITYRGKKDFILSSIKLLGYFLLKRPDIVHAHLLAAQLIALPVAALAWIKKRIYTRHNSNYHQAYFPKGIKYDKLSNRLSTHIVSISQATYKTLTLAESVNPAKIRTIPHGFDFSIFQRPGIAPVAALKSKWKIPQGLPCIGVIARHVQWKGIDYIIEAFAKFIQKYPFAILVLANANGPYHQKLLELLSKIPSRNFVLIPFEEDIVSLYALFDIYVHTPVDKICEAFGQTYIEALAAGIPSIFTLSGIADEFIKADEHAIVVEYKNSDSIFLAMNTLWSDENLRRSLSLNGQKAVFSRFKLTQMISSLQELYHE